MRIYTRTPDPQCSIEGCERPVRATKGSNGMCGKHAQRVRRYGNPHHVTTEDERRVLCREAQPALGKAKPTTYKKYLGRHLHRQVAEQKIGRALLPGEIVHHIDGDKHNNAPGNLEVLIDQSYHAKVHRKHGGRFSSC